MDAGHGDPHAVDLPDELALEGVQLALFAADPPKLTPADQKETGPPRRLRNALVIEPGGGRPGGPTMALARIQPDTIDAAEVPVDNDRVWLDDHPEGTRELEDSNKSVEYWLAFLISEVANLDEQLGDAQERIARLERRQT
jgi:hypothetical protein